MSNRIVSPIKVAKIKHLIERQILLRVDQLTTFVQLRKAIEQRMFHGQLLEHDLQFIANELKKMSTTLTEQENLDGQDNP